MLIGGLQKLTLIDYPGKLACTVFTIGCNFRCPFCYSAELVSPEKIKKQPRVPEKEFFKFLKSKKGLIDGVVVCGGEPTINEDLPDFIKKIKKMKFLVKLDTNGSNPEMLKRLIDEKLVDYAAMDVKAPIEKNKYEKCAGVKIDLDKIRKSIQILKENKIDCEFRTTVVPSFHTKEDIVQIAAKIAPAKKYYLQNFRPEKNLDKRFQKEKPYPKEYLLEVQKIIASYFNVCGIR